MTTIKRLVATLFALVVTLPLLAVEVTPMLKVRDMAKSMRSMKVEQDIYIEGFIISEPRGYNNELNGQRYYSAVTDTDLRTGYIESLNGDVGFRIYFAKNKYATSFPRYARVLLTLKGTTVEFQSPCRVTINGLAPSNIERLIQCDASALPRKEMSIKDIKDDDIYTYVTLKDCEMVFKDGSFSNVYERYVQSSPINKKLQPNGSMDCWPNLICDKSGSTIYSLVNTKCRWRRDGRGVPQGAGDMRGIVTYTYLPRYGGNVLGGYVLRPVDKSDYAMDWGSATAVFKSIAEWNWNDNNEAFVTESGRKKSITDEAIKADIGTGVLKVNVKGTITRGKDTNNHRIAAPADNDFKGAYGLVNRGALRITTPAFNWWNWEKDCGNGVELEFSTEGLSGENLFVAFSFAAGDISAQTSYGFPVYWNVEFSDDGKSWFRSYKCNAKKLRALPWWYDNNIYGSSYESVEAGPGMTEHFVRLPKSLFGKKKVYVRIVPVTKNMATLGYDYSENGALRPNSMAETMVNFGSIVVRYN